MCSSDPWSCGSRKRRAGERGRFIASQRTEYDVPHAVACRALGVSESWFYKWRDRPTTPRQDRRSKLAAAVGKVFDDSGGTCGSPRIGIELRDQGWQVSDNTIAQLMAELGLAARVKRRRRGLTRQGSARRHRTWSDGYHRAGAGRRLVRRHDRDRHR